MSRNFSDNYSEQYKFHRTGRRFPKRSAHRKPQYGNDYFSMPKIKNQVECRPRANRQQPPRTTSPLPGSEERTQRNIQETSKILHKFLEDHPNDEIVLPSTNNQEAVSEGCNNEHKKTQPSAKIHHKSGKSVQGNLTPEQILEMIQERIANLSRKKKLDFVTKKSYAYDVAIQQLQRQNRVALSRELRDVANRKVHIGNCKALNEIIPDIAINLEELPNEAIVKMSDLLNVDLEPLIDAEKCFQDAQTMLQGGGSGNHLFHTDYIKSESSYNNEPPPHMVSAPYSHSLNNYQYTLDTAENKFANDNIATDYNHTVKCHIRPGRASSRNEEAYSYGPQRIKLKRERFDPDECPVDGERPLSLPPPDHQTFSTPQPVPVPVMVAPPPPKYDEISALFKQPLKESRNIIKVRDPSEILGTASPPLPMQDHRNQVPPAVDDKVSYSTYENDVYSEQNTRANNHHNNTVNSHPPKEPDVWKKVVVIQRKPSTASTGSHSRESSQGRDARDKFKTERSHYSTTSYYEDDFRNDRYTSSKLYSRRSRSRSPKRSRYNDKKENYDYFRRTKSRSQSPCSKSKLSDSNDGSKVSYNYFGYDNESIKKQPLPTDTLDEDLDYDESQDMDDSNCIEDLSESTLPKADLEEINSEASDINMNDINEHENDLDEKEAIPVHAQESVVPAQTLKRPELNTKGASIIVIQATDKAGTYKTIKADKITIVDDIFIKDQPVDTHIRDNDKILDKKEKTEGTTDSATTPLPAAEAAPPLLPPDSPHPEVPSCSPTPPVRPVPRPRGLRARGAKSKTNHQNFSLKKKYLEYLSLMPKNNSSRNNTKYHHRKNTNKANNRKRIRKSRLDRRKKQQDQAVQTDPDGSETLRQRYDKLKRETRQMAMHWKSMDQKIDEIIAERKKLKELFSAILANSESEDDVPEDAELLNGLAPVKKYYLHYYPNKDPLMNRDGTPEMVPEAISSESRMGGSPLHCDVPQIDLSSNSDPRFLLVAPELPDDVLESASRQDTTPKKKLVADPVRYEPGELEQCKHESETKSPTPMELDSVSTDELPDHEEEVIDDDCIEVEEEVQVQTSEEAFEFRDWQNAVLVAKVLDENVVIAGDASGRLYYFSLINGECLYSVQLSSKEIVSICVPKNRKDAYVGCLDGELHALNFDDREIVKHISVSTQIQCIESLWDIIFVGSRTGKIIRYDINHKKLSHPISISDEAIMAIKANVEGARRVLLIATRDSSVTIRDARNGLLLRKISDAISHPRIYSLLFHKNRIYCGTSRDNVLVYGFQDGRLMLKHEEPQGTGVICLTMVEDLLFVACYSGHIYVYDTTNNSCIADIPTPPGLFLCMDVTKNQIIAGTKQHFKCIPLPPSVLERFQKPIND